MFTILNLKQNTKSGDFTELGKINEKVRGEIEAFGLPNFS